MKRSFSNLCAYSEAMLMILVFFVNALAVPTKSSDSVGTRSRAGSLWSQTTAQESKAINVRDLKPRAPIERELKGGEAHSYRIVLTARQYLHIVVEQKGIDVVVRLFGPDGQKVGEVDSPNGTQGPEPLTLIAAAAGEYRFEVKSLEEKAPPGRYEVKLEELREATKKDWDRTAAERALVEAEQLRVQGTSESLRQTLDKYNEALKLFKAIDDRDRVAFTLNSMGERYRELGESQTALGFHGEAASLRQSIGDRYGEGESLHNMGVDYWQLGNSEKALEYYNQALPFLHALDNRQPEAVTLGAIGLAYENLGKLAEAIDYTNQSIVIHQQLGNRRSQANALINLGMPYFRLGEWQKAFDCLSQALSLIRGLGDRRLEGSVLSNIGFFYWQIGENQKALEYYNQALPIRRATGDRNGEANTLHNIGSAYESLGDAQKALEYFNQALPLIRTLGDRRGEAFTLQNIGLAYRLLGEPQKALDFLNQALVLRQAAADRLNEAVTLDRIGTTYSSLGKLDEASEYLERALSLQRLVGARNDEAVTLHHIASVKRRQGHLAIAKTQIETALDIVESTRSKFVGQQFRTSVSASTQDYYELYITLLMQMHHAEPSAGYDVTAFGATERARARSLLELLAESRADIRQGVDPALLERERALQQQLNARSQGLTRLLGVKHTEEQETAARKEVESVLTAYQDTQAEIRRKSPRYAALAQPQPLSLKEIQKSLDNGTLLLEYALGEEHSYLWAVTSTSIKSFELPKRSEIEALAQSFYKLVTNNENRELEFQLEAASALSKVLLAPVASELGQKQLVIVSDGSLQYVPFAALPLPYRNGESRAVSRRSRNNKKTTDQYQALTVEHEIVQLPSASVLSALMHQTEGRLPAPHMVAVLADPVFQIDDPRIKQEKATTSVSPNPNLAGSNESRVELDLKRSAWESGLQDLTRLPFSRREAEAIVALLPAQQSLMALDFDASLETVKSKQLSQYRIIHFATHGLLNNVHPELSGLVLSLVAKDGKPQDGFVRLNEIYNLNLPAELVVLSACRTALGKDIKGEGLVGLTRGFMYAGARRVVVSLWDVNDTATAEFMKKFYEGMLKKKMRPAAALRAAQLEMSKSRWWNAPYYWAGFVLQGDWR